jgi:glycosyltransferase involved in cell wall biosynthesis
MASKPRLAVCIGSFEYGGQGTVVEQELLQLREKFSVTLVTESIERPVPADVATVKCSAWSVFPIPRSGLVRLLRRFDLVHCHDSLGFMMAAALTGKHFVVTAHGIAPIALRRNGRSKLEGLITLATYPRLYRRSRLVVAISSYIAEWLRGFAHIQAKVIRNGTIRVSSQPSAPSRRNLLYVGAIERRKGIRDLIHSLKSVPSDVTLDLVGRGDASEYIKQAMREFTINRIRFHGEVDQRRLEDLYTTAFCSCSASYWEGFGLPTLDGFGFGRPAIVRSQGGLAELIELSGAGFGFRDASEVGTYVHEVTADWDRLSNQALRYASGRTWPKVFGEYCTAFEELLGAPLSTLAPAIDSSLHGGPST